MVWPCSRLGNERINLVLSVLRLFGQRLVNRRDSGVLEFHYRRISAVKQWKSLRSWNRAANQKKIFFRTLQSHSWRLPADQKVPLGLRPRGLISMLEALYPIEHSRWLSNPYWYLNDDNKAANNNNDKAVSFSALIVFLTAILGNYIT